MLRIVTLAIDAKGVAIVEERNASCWEAMDVRLAGRKEKEEQDQN